MIALPLFGFNSGYLSKFLMFPVPLKLKIQLEMSRESMDGVESQHSCRGGALGSIPVGTQETVRFGKDFEVDLRAFELRCAGRPLKLERIPMQVLLILIEQRGQLVTREEIAGKIWGKDVFLDTDNSINGAIRKIRQVLKDDPQEPRFVQTLPGRGYRFIAPVEEEKFETRAPDRHQSLLPQEPEPETTLAQPIAGGNENTTGNTPGAVALGRRRRFVWVVSLLSFCAIVLATWIGWTHFYGRAHPIRSIAVLPLQNLSGDPAQEYFADGMTEELITELSRIHSLRVISHTSVMEYKGTRKHLPEIARELGVDGILEGSVIRENDEVRVTVQLLDGPKDRHIWSESYERPLHGILNLQREVAEAVTRQIRITLTPEQEARLNAARTVDPEAYEAYLRGRYFLSTQYTLEQPLLQAKSDFEQSIHKDPGFAPAYSGLGDAYLYLALFRYVPEETGLQSALDALHKALQLDDSIGEAHDTLGLISWRHDWNLEAAERELDQAIALAPSYPCAHEDRAEFLALLGRRAEALAELTRINQIDFGPSAAMTEAGVYFQLRDYQNLLETSRRGVASNPNEWVEHLNLGIGYEGTGKLPEAIIEYQRAVELSNGDQDARGSLAHALAVTGNRIGAEAILRDLEHRSKDSYVSPYVLATIYAGLGEKGKAFQYLEKAYDERSLDISWHLKADLRIDNLRSDPRFQDLARRIGLPQ
jgi:TolB-like protein/DNA-binding winged helix-turn-helix (wHTH) protein/Flp pilus assembly protein TadD